MELSAGSIALQLIAANLEWAEASEEMERAQLAVAEASASLEYAAAERDRLATALQSAASGLYVTTTNGIDTAETDLRGLVGAINESVSAPA